MTGIPVMSAAQLRIELLFNLMDEKTHGADGVDPEVRHGAMRFPANALYLGPPDPAMAEADPVEFSGSGMMT